MRLNISRFLSLVALALLAGGRLASAQVMDYTETAVASGTFNGVSFSSDLVTFNMVANTGSVTNPTTGFFRVDNTYATVTVAGVGTGTILTPTYTFDNNTNSVAGIDTYLSFGPPEPDTLDIESSSLASYNLQSTLDTVTGTLSYYSPYGLGTSNGSLQISSISGDLTFEASPYAAPEPSSWILGMGACAVFIYLRRRAVGRRHRIARR